MFRSLLTLGLFFALSVESASAQLTIENFSTATNSRFVNDAAFIGAGYDFSGVSRNNNGRWGTLISPNAVLTVGHVRPPVGSVYPFYPDNDPNSTPVEAIVTSTHRVGATDLEIAILDRNLGPSFAVYKFATTPYSGDPPVFTTNPDGTTSIETSFNTDSSQVDIVGQRAFVFGVSQAISPIRALNQAVGENRVFAFSENVFFNGNTDNDSIIFQKDEVGSSNALTYETHVNNGDSGAPNFLVDSATNELILIGANSYRLDEAAPGTFLSSGVTYTGNQVAEINTILDANIIEPTLLGDCNLDGVVNVFDVSTFISFLSTGDYLEEADMNQDDTVNVFDVSLFIAALSGN